MGSYEKFSNTKNEGNSKCEIIVWNLQRDMIELFSSRPPWNVPVYKKFVAHDDSIIELCYL
jgi:WD40 repeat protein